MADDEERNAPPSLPRVERVPDYVTVLDRDGTIIAASRAPVGRVIADLLGSNVRNWIEPSAHAEFDRALAEVFDGRESRVISIVGTVTGQRFESHLTPLWGRSSVEHAALVSHDVTERRREQEALRESEQRFRALVEGAFEGLMISVDGHIAVANAALAGMLRCRIEDVIGRTGRDFCTPESYARVMQNVRANVEAPYEITAVRPDGSTFPCEVLGRNIVYRGAPARLTGLRDVTERHRLERERKDFEEQLLQAQKLESLGMLAGGIAHDFNNVLMIVLANVEVALGASGLPATAGARLDDIRIAALRGRELTQQLLNYAAQGPLTTRVVDLSELARETLAMIAISVPQQVELVLQPAAAPAVVQGDPAQLRQLIMNLVINAAEALANRAGRIVVRTEHVQLAPGDIEGGPLVAQIPEGRAVALHIVDTGQGMDATTLKRIFDPFFTTKFTGRGLGLASVLSIVRGHGGAIRVQSAPGRGTEFTIWLAECASEAARSAPPRPPAALGRAVGLALFADDEPLLRNVGREMLTQLGFEVVLAEDGEAAMRAFEQHSERLALIVLDLTMPKLSGVEALHRIRARSTVVPVICMSGYSAEHVDLQLPADPHTHFLPKPWSIAELTAAIQAVRAVPGPS